MGGGKNFCGRQKKGAFHSVPGERVKSRQNRAQGWWSEESAYESCPPFLIAFLVLPPPSVHAEKDEKEDGEPP